MYLFVNREHSQKIIGFLGTALSTFSIRIFYDTKVFVVDVAELICVIFAF